MQLNFERIPLLGVAVLIVSALPALFLCTHTNQMDQIGPFMTKTSANKSLTPITDQFALPLADHASFFLDNPESQQIAFSMDPPRPSATNSSSHILIRLAQSKQMKRVELPAKVGLEFKNGQALQFADAESPSADLFWLDCKLATDNQIAASLYLKTPDEETICKASWTSALQGTPLLNAEEISTNSPFRKLAEAKWWGQDLFAEQFGLQPVLQRIEIGPDAKLLQLTANDWLIFKDGNWIIDSTADKTSLPIAHIRGWDWQGLEIEGWENSCHLRFKIPFLQSFSLKTKGEELFSQLRVRSEKQVSCIIDKQCLIMRLDDWALKTNHRWKILRKKEEKDAFLAGHMIGELFVLERIDSKGAIKSISGRLFSPKRSQATQIEFTQAPKANQSSQSNPNMPTAKSATRGVR